MGPSARATADAASAPPESPPLSDVAIVRAARELIAEVGVDGLTMRRLSAKLDVALGATYHHVPTKHALVVLVAQDLYREVELPAAGDGDWADRVKAIIVSTARVIGEYPGMANYMMTHMDDMVPTELQAVMVDVLRDAGFREHSIQVVLSALYFYGTGMSANMLPIREAEAFGDADVPALFDEGLDMLLAGARLRLDADLAHRAARRKG
jgi:AcrR family transcriptional regulator